MKVLVIYNLCCQYIMITFNYLYELRELGIRIEYYDNENNELIRKINKLEEYIKELENKIDSSPKKKILKDDLSSKTILSVTKQITTTGDNDKINVYQNEKKWLTILKDSRYIAKPIHFDDSTRTITLEYAGENVNAKNLPENWEEQRDNILLELESYNCAHNDIKPGEILVHDGQIKIVDFGWAHELNEKYPSYWPTGVGDIFKCNEPGNEYNDRYSFNKSIQHILKKK